MSDSHRFTNRQITAMVAAICAAVIAYPAFGYAASLTSVKITDNGHTAKVSKAGSLQTAGSVTGTVAARPVLPAHPYTVYGAYKSITVPLGYTFVIQTVSCLIANPTLPPAFVLAYTADGKQQAVFLSGPTEGPDLGGGNTWSVTQAVTLYAQSNTTVTCGEAAGDAAMTLSGYLS
jgi:hypothetical protein